MYSKNKSRYLSLILRHKPEKANLKLDSAGWVEVETLLSALGWPKADLDEIVTLNDKKRFEYSDDGKKIRASQGHSVEVDLEYAPVTPPDTLYHGTVEEALPGIRSDGLKPMKRVHVHLSSDVETAEKVGARHGKPVILTIDARKMVGEGFKFYLSTNGVWLTEHVPAEFITPKSALYFS